MVSSSSASSSWIWAMVSVSVSEVKVFFFDPFGFDNGAVHMEEAHAAHVDALA